MKLAVGIVLYNPDLRRLKKSLEQFDKNVDRIFLVDNGSKNIEDIRNIRDKRVLLIENGKNLGIAAALNMVVEAANEANCSYLLTLDQDSIMKKEALARMLKYTDREGVAIVCPRVLDINKAKQKVSKEEIEEISRCITSGSLMNLKLCNKVGIFNEKMFIDFVDFEYCKRIKLAGLKILRVNSAELEHEVGKRTKRHFLFITLYPTNHNKERVYYYGRNLAYYRNKFKKHLNIGEKINLFATKIWKIGTIVLYEKDKSSKLKKFFDGQRDGKRLSKVYVGGGK